MGGERDAGMGGGTGERAEVVELGPSWDAGAPLPFVVASEAQVAIAYRAAGGAGVGVIAFDQDDHRFGSPNDETLHGHRLWGRGLVHYRAHEVHESTWVAESMAVAAVHDRYDPRRWTDVRHFLLAFHDSTFECLATAHQSALLNEDLTDVAARLTRNLVEGGTSEPWR